MNELEKQVADLASPFGVSLYLCSHGRFAIWFKLRDADDIPEFLMCPTIPGAHLLFVHYMIETSDNPSW